MDSSVAALLGTAVGALTTLAVTVVTFWFQADREKRQAKFAAVARVAESLAKLQVSMDWIIWLGEHQPNNLNDAEIKGYSERVMPQFGELLGAVALLGGFSTELYKGCRGLYDQALGVDEHINERLERKGLMWPQIREQAEAFYAEWDARIHHALGRPSPAPVPEDK